MTSSEGEEEEKASVVISKSEGLPLPCPSFLEVTCKSSGKVWRFAAGTEAVFAVRVINHKIDAGYSQARVFYIESVKEGEEPVIFGPNAVLVDYGGGWKLQTAVAQDRGERSLHAPPRKHSDILTETDAQRAAVAVKKRGLHATLSYFGKILLTFIFMFIIGGLFTYILENLPELIAFSSSLF